VLPVAIIAGAEINIKAQTMLTALTQAVEARRCRYGDPVVRLLLATNFHFLEFSGRFKKMIVVGTEIVERYFADRTWPRRFGLNPAANSQSERSAEDHNGLPARRLSTFSLRLAQPHTRASAET
jgi:hypothetical protein